MTDAPKSTKKNTNVIVVVVAAVLGAVLFTVLTNGGDKKATTVTTTTAPGSEPAETPGATPGVEPGETQIVTLTGDVLPNLVDGPDTAVGKTPAKLNGYKFEGQPITLDPLDGKAKIVMFVAHWCPHCQREVPRVTAWQAEGKLPTDVEYFTVSTGVVDSRPNYPPSAWLAKEKWPFPVMADDKSNTASKAYGLSSFPFFVALRADGTVAARMSGEQELDGFLAFVAKAKA